MTRPVDTVPNTTSRLRMTAIRATIERHTAHQILNDEPVTPNPRALPGDTRRLRGIPAIGYGVQGAIPGTRPDTATR